MVGGNGCFPPFPALGAYAESARSQHSPFADKLNADPALSVGRNVISGVALEAYATDLTRSTIDSLTNGDDWVSKVLRTPSGWTFAGWQQIIVLPND